METYPTIPKRPCSVFAPSISGHVTLFFRCLSVPIYVAEINLKSSYLRKNWNIPKPIFNEFQRIFGYSVCFPQNYIFWSHISWMFFSLYKSPSVPYRWHGNARFWGHQVVTKDPWKFQRTSRWGRRTACFPGRCLGSADITIMIVMFS